MWVYQSKEENKKLILYDFCLNRSSDNPQLVLNHNHRAYIQTDGYSGYNFLSKNPKIIRLGCMAHARRKFADIAKLIKIKNNSSKIDIIAHQVVNKITQIYRWLTRINNLVNCEMSIIIILIIATIYDSGFNYALDNGAGIGCSLTIGISLLFAKYCENPLAAIVYFLKKRPHTYSELKDKIGSYRFAYEAELDYLKERGQISYSYTGKRDPRVISLVDDDL